MKTLLLLAAILLVPGLASAQDYSVQQPDLISFGVSYYDFNDNNPRNPATDFRLEYRSGTSLLPMISAETFQSWEPIFQVRPTLGVEATSDGAFYGFGGFLYEFLIGKHFAITPSTVVGLYSRGDGKRLGSIIEFRSMLEAAYRFDSGWRVSAQISHISNAGITDRNPGVNMVGGYIHVPFNSLY